MWKGNAVVYKTFIAAAAAAAYSWEFFAGFAKQLVCCLYRWVLSAIYSAQGARLPDCSDSEWLVSSAVCFGWADVLEALLRMPKLAPQKFLVLSFASSYAPRQLHT